MSRPGCRAPLVLVLLSCMLAGCARPASMAAPDHAPTVDHAAMHHAPATASPGAATSPTIAATSSPAPSPELATSAAQPVLTPEPVARLTGSGEGASAEFRLAPGLVFFTIKHPTDTPFAVYLMNDKGDHLALLANATQVEGGSRAYGVEHEGSYYLHVIAADDWAAEVAQPATVAPASGSTPETFEGRGPAATLPFTLKGGTTSFTWQHGGITPFTLLVLDAAGRRVATVAESSTTKSGTWDTQIPADGVYLLDVGADGEWTVMVRR